MLPVFCTTAPAETGKKLYDVAIPTSIETSTSSWVLTAQPELRTDNFTLNLTGQTDNWEVYAFLMTDLFEAEAGPRFRLRNPGLQVDSLDFTFRGGVVWQPEAEMINFQVYFSGIMRVGRVTLVMDNEFKLGDQYDFVPSWAYNEGHLIIGLGSGQLWQVGGFYERFHHPRQTMWVVGPRVSRTWSDIWLREAVFEVGLTDSRFAGFLLTFGKPN
ncbi:hypothetical protein ACFL0L_04870 [Patescibacteria group bacterium]